MLPPLDVTTERPKPRISEDVLRLVGMMRKVAWANLYFGLINIAFYLTGYDMDESMFTTGVVSICMYFLVKAKISYINGAKSWIEISVTAACGLYLPMFTLLLTYLNLVGLLGGN